MTTEDEELTPAERAARLQARLSQNVKTFETQIVPQPTQTWDSDLVPEASPANGYIPTEEDRRLDAFLDSLDAVDAYVKFIGKMTPKERRSEGVMISCPIPGHVDQNPSAWINSEKKVWFCGACQEGGDIYDLAAIKFGYPRPDYKTNGQFGELKRKLAEAYGFTFVKGLGGKQYGVEPPKPPDPEPPTPPGARAPDPTPPPEPTSAPPIVTYEPPPQEGPGGAKILAFPGTDLEEIPEEIRRLALDWDEIVTPGTFLYEWQHAVTKEDLPHEYYLFQAYQALGFAGGMNIMLADFQPVKPNFYMCLYGPTGIGKTRSTYPYRRLLREVMPWTGDDKYSDPEGVLLVPSPNSAEALIDNFNFPVLDASTQKIDHTAPVKGLVQIEEFASFMARASRLGSTMKETFIEFKDVSKGGQVTVHSRTTGIVRARSPFMQVLTTTQPKAIHAFTRRTDTESGLLNRWLFVVGWPRIAPIAYGHGQADITVPANLFRDIVAWAHTERMYTLTGNALAVWTDFFNEHMAPMKSGAIEVESMVSRVDYALKQLIVVLSMNEMLDQPTDSVVEKALKHFPYLKATFSMVSGDIVHSETAECQAAIVRVIDQTVATLKRFPSRRDIVRGLGSKFDSETILKAFKILVDLEVIEERRPEVGEPGRPTTRYSNVTG